jgi:hypothetical protein
MTILAWLSHESPISEPVIKNKHLSDVLSNFNKALSEFNRKNGLNINQNKLKVIELMGKTSVQDLCSAFMSLYPHWFSLSKFREIFLCDLPDCEAARELLLECFKLQSRSNRHTHGWEHYGSCLRGSISETIIAQRQPQSFVPPNYCQIHPDKEIYAKGYCLDCYQKLARHNLVDNNLTDELYKFLAGEIKYNELSIAHKLKSRTKFKDPPPKCLVHPNTIGRRKDSLCNNCTTKLRRLGLQDYPLDEVLFQLLSRKQISLKSISFCINHPTTLTSYNNLCTECNKEVGNVLRRIRDDKQKENEMSDNINQISFRLRMINSGKIHEVKGVYTVGKLTLYSVNCGKTFIQDIDKYETVSLDNEVDCKLCLKVPRKMAIKTEKIIDEMDTLDKLIKQMDYAPINIFSNTRQEVR